MAKRFIRKLYAGTGRTAFIILYPFFALYLSKDERTRVVLRYGNEVLLVKAWAGNGMWELPGGGLHKKEQPAEGASREINEELGLKIAANRFMPLGSEMYKLGLIKYRLHFFLVNLNRRPEMKLQRLEIIEAKWFTTVELAGLKINNHHRQLIYVGQEVG